MNRVRTGPIQVAFDVTSNCNLRCVHCFNNSGSDAPFRDLPREKKLEIARQIGEFHPINVCLCGGETLCCPYLLEIIDILQPQVGKVSMVSNGYLMTKQMAAALKEHGVAMVQISIDGSCAWQHDSFRGVPGSFERAVNAVRYLKEAGFEEIDISLVPNRLNYDTMDDFFSLCFEIGVNQIRIMPFLPSGRGTSIGKNLMLNEEEYFVLMRDILRLQAEYRGRMTLQWGDPVDHMRRMPNNAKLGMTTYVLDINTNGNLTFTPYLPISAGNCCDHSLQEYWAAGYNTIWGNKNFLQYTEQVRNIYDLENFEPQPYTGEMIKLDLLDNSNAETEIDK